MGRAVRIVIAAALLGSLPALLLADSNTISVQLWLGATAAWTAWLVVVSVLGRTEPLPARSQLLLFRWRRGDAQLDPRPRSLQALHGTVLNSRDNGRAYALRLRPRVIAVADHLLAANHGIALESEPHRAQALLGDLYPLIDPTTDGGPTLPQDLQRLLDLLDATQTPASPELQTETAS